MSDPVAASEHSSTTRERHERPRRPDETDLGRTDPELELQATLVLRPATAADAGASEMQTALEFCRAHQLTIADVSEERRSVHFTARTDLIEQAFSIELIDVARGNLRYRRFRTPPQLPAGLREIVTGVFGLRSRPIPPRVRVHHAGSLRPFWTIHELAEAYEFPTEADGRGQVIALIELGGGFHASDMQAYFAGLGMPVPEIQFISVDGATNAPASPEAIGQFLEVVEGKRAMESVDEQLLASAQATVEVTMDIQLAGALAPGASIVVYMAPMTEQGMCNALRKAVSSEEPQVDVISISWGEAEPRLSEAYRQAVNDALADAAAKGITVCASSGDAGAANDSPDEMPCVNFPASSPLALACGGSTVMRTEAVIEKEVAWNCGPHGIPASSGGGVSRAFPVPDWQRGHPVPLAPNQFAGRGVPDVAAPADPHTGCAILVGGFECCSAGTSAAAPLWAALIARCNQVRGSRCGQIHPLLYKAALAGEGSPLRAIVEGTNGVYQAGPGWNPCTGLGTPRGRRLLEVLTGNGAAAMPRAS